MFNAHTKTIGVKTVNIDGNTLTYRDEGTGLPIVFLHGALINGATWNPVISYLSKHFRCIAPDLPLGGHSHAVDNNIDLSPPGIARILDTFVWALDLPKFILVGNDTGGAYAQVYVASYPDKVSHLVLSNCDALDVFPPKHFSSLQKFINAPGYLRTMGFLFRNKSFLQSPQVFGHLSNCLSGEDIYSRFSHNFSNISGVRRNFRKVVNGWSTTHTLEAAAKLVNYRKSVLLIWGEDDQILFPLSLGQRLAAVFPNAQLDVVPKSLTYVQEDQPRAFADRMRNFLDVS